MSTPNTTSREPLGVTVLCHHCGFPNRIHPGSSDLEPRCEECNERLPHPYTRRGRLRLWFRAHWLAIWLAWSGGVGFALGAYGWHEHKQLHQLETQWEEKFDDIKSHDRTALKTMLAKRLEQLSEARVQAEARFQSEAAAINKKLKDEAFLSGSLARQRQQAEWDQRLRHEPALAVTPLERALVKIEQVGQDPKIAARVALETVARMVAPSDSRVEITPDGDKFIIKVAFKMSSLSPRERGVGTKHQSIETMRWEAEIMCARVMQELFGSCGWRGIRKMQVSCNHAVRRLPSAEGAVPDSHQNAEASEVIMEVLFRCSLSEKEAGKVANWRLLSPTQVADLMVVEKDAFRDLSIRRDPIQSIPQTDPAGPLEF